VPILDNFFGPHLSHLQRALSRTAERHSLLTANIANLNTPGYKRKDLDFSIALDEELGQAGGEPGLSAPDRISRIDSSASLRLDGNTVDLEREVMSLAETELRYQALSDMASQHIAGLKNVIREGR
jgi:flagellar basal-body rod protein FlgB